MMNQNNISLERVIKGLKYHSEGNCFKSEDDETGCPYWKDSFCSQHLCSDALTLLKEREPRVMTLGDLRDIGSVWELNTPPYLWMDINPSYRWSRGFWVAWREIYDMIDGLHPTYDADNYGKIWRCWTSKPSLKQMEETPWL